MSPDEKSLTAEDIKVAVEKLKESERLKKCSDCGVTRGKLKDWAFVFDYEKRLVRDVCANCSSKYPELPHD